MHYITRPLIFGILLLMIIACGGASQSQPIESQTTISPTSLSSNSVQVTSEPTVSANRTTILDNRVSFILPDGFSALSAAEIKAKFPRTNAPQYVFANPTQSVSIAVTQSTDVLRPAQLHSFKDQMELALERNVPDIEWLLRGYVTIAGQEWIHFESITPAIDTKIHNNMYFTSFDGRPLIFNFNSTVDQYDTAKYQLEACKDSISFHE